MGDLYLWGAVQWVNMRGGRRRRRKGAVGESPHSSLRELEGLGVEGHSPFGSDDEEV